MSPYRAYLVIGIVACLIRIMVHSDEFASPEDEFATYSTLLITSMVAWPWVLGRAIHRFFQERSHE